MRDLRGSSHRLLHRPRGNVRRAGGAVNGACDALHVGPMTGHRFIGIGEDRRQIRARIVPVDAIEQLVRVAVRVGVGRVQRADERMLGAGHRVAGGAVEQTKVALAQLEETLGDY